MKRRLLRFLTILTLLSSAWAAQANINHKSLKEIADRYTANLQFINEGVVLTSMQQLVSLRYHFPEADLEDAVKQLQVLVLSGTSTAIRYSAFISLSYLQHPKLFSNLNTPLNGRQERDRFFKLLVEHLAEEAQIQHTPANASR